MRSRLYLVATLAAVLTVGATTAQAGYPVPEAKPRVIQTTHLLATSHVKAWQSKPLALRRTLYVHIYQRGQEIKQHYINGCAASYNSRGLIVRMRVNGCSRHRFTIQLRYISLSRQYRFKVRLTTSSCDGTRGSIC